MGGFEFVHEIKRRELKQVEIKNFTLIYLGLSILNIQICFFNLIVNILHQIHRMKTIGLNFLLRRFLFHHEPHQNFHYFFMSLLVIFLRRPKQP